MLWKDIKFWVWAIVEFPLPLTADRFGVGPQGPQTFEGPQGAQYGDCGPEITSTYEVCFDVINFSSDFELNAIPTATIGLALGRKGNDVSQASLIHYYADQMQTQLRIKVWCRAKSAAGSDPDILESLWPAEQFIIFEGYITGSGFRRGPGGAEMTLSLTHWLTDLNFSSALSGQSHPLNPAQLYNPANFIIDTALTGNNFGTSTGPYATGAALAYPYFTAATVINTDFWGGVDNDLGHVNSGLKDWLLFMTLQNRINFQQIVRTTSGSAGADLDPQLNWEGCRALSRFEPNAIVDGVETPGYVLGVPLALAFRSDIDVTVANNIAEDIGRDSLSSFTGTLWDKLAGEFHSSYMYSIVPLIRTALVVPFVPGLTSVDPSETEDACGDLISRNNDNCVHRVLRSHHYETFDMASAVPRPLRAVGILVHKNNSAGGGTSGNRTASYTSFGGYFDKLIESCDARYKEGLILFKHGPRWMSNPIYYPGYTPTSTGVSSGATVQTSTAPTAGQAATGNDPTTQIEQSSSIWNAYARAVYIHEVLKGRQGSITGPVRFDIAPGSTIKVEVPQDKFVREIVYECGAQCSDECYDFMYCSVLRVSTVIDCQNLKAFTSYHLAHLRTPTENVDPGTSIFYHPIWQGHTWAGCVLVQDEAFEPLATTQDLSPPTVTNLSPAFGSADGGETVVITGTGFFLGGVQNVWFGPWAVPEFEYSIDSDTQITITTQADTQAEFVYVVVETDTGLSYTSPESKFTFGA